MNTIGILDPEGISTNPLTGNSYSDKYKQLAKIWSQLPGYAMATKVIDIIKNNQIILIVAETGSGKTVLVPKFALHALNYNGSVAITMPKQIITKASAEYSANTLDVELGKEVGYQYKGSPVDSKSSSTKLLYATDGTIVARLLNDPKLTSFDIVIIDEAHERKIQIDFLLYLLRNVLKVRPEFKIIIMSATINSTVFERYFDEFKFKQIMMSGRTNYPIESIFLNNKLEYRQTIEKGYDILTNLIDNNDNNDNIDNDILFFVTSSNEAFDICTRIHKNEKYSNIFCIELFSGMDSKYQELAQNNVLYKQNTNYVRKLVISTNVAESSLTIDGIKYVIDSGYELKGSYDPETHADKLDRTLISNAQAKQRMGRAGRTSPGICYHLYTKNEFDNEMEKFPQPDIRVSNLDTPSLKLMNTGIINDVQTLIKTYSQFIEPPKELYIRSAINDLIHLGVIDLDGITPLGKLISDMNLDIMPAICIIIAKMYNCLDEVITILSVLDSIKYNISNLFIRPKDLTKSDEQQFTKAKKSFIHKYGDHLSILNVFNDFNKIYEKYINKPEFIDDWISAKFLKRDPLLKAIHYSAKLRNNIKTLLPDKLNYNDLSLKYNDDVHLLTLDNRIILSFTIGFNLNIGFINKNDIYRTKYSDNYIRINRNSFINIINENLPNEVTYCELFTSMGRSELNIVSKIPKKIYKYI